MFKASFFMANITKSKTQIEKTELEQNKKIKPKLRKFVIEGQRKRAEEVAKAKTKEENIMLASEEVIQRASKLATKALLGDRIWQRIPPLLEWRWTRFSLSAQTPQTQTEMNSDIAGFATYLVREYRNFLTLGKTTSRGYLSPLDDKNIEFFWSKFNADLKLLIDAEMNRVKKGNASVILGRKDENGKIVPIGKRVLN